MMLVFVPGGEATPAFHDHSTVEKANQQKPVVNKPGPKRKLSVKEELFMVLVKLKVGLFVKDLAARFHISSAHCTKIFITWVNLLHLELKELFPIPSQDLIRKNMPSQFDPYPTTRFIIDCTEFYMQVASSMNAQSETWSNYKHKNTIKFLIAVTPNGRVCYVSEPWGGRVSDKELTKNCHDLLAALAPGDNVMADRGFEIKGILPEGVSLNIPPFKGSRNQLTAEETEETMKIAAVRIIVEQAIGAFKKFHILDGVIPISCTKVIHQIVCVCAFLTNFEPPIFPPKNTLP